jgi:D-glycero-D-manno-heptose 1,7-bisphosphate phosphatase
VSEAAGRACVFLDRDGTLIEDPGYVHRAEDLRFLPGVPEGLERLKRAGYLLIVVTNQSGVAHGHYPESAVHTLHAHMNAELGPQAAIDAFYYAPYHPQALVPAYRRISELRKPAIGMFQRAAAEHAIAVSRSYMVGDRDSDLEFGRASGLRPILVLTGHGREHAGAADCAVAEDFEAVVKLILAGGASGRALPGDS